LSLTAAQLLYPTLARAVRANVTARAAVGFVKRFFQKAPVRPGMGSKVTSGPLKVGKVTLYGKSGVSTAAKVAGAVGVGGVATVASHRRAAVTRPSPSPAPRRSTTAPASTSTDRKCCPVGTKRMVCFKRGRVKGKPHASKPMAHRSRANKARRKVTKKTGSGVPKRAVSAKQAAARKRFAAAARRGKIRKGSTL